MHLDSALLGTMASAFGITAPEDLQAQDPDSETASFLELLFYPDMATRGAFEREWGLRRWSPEAPGALLAELEKQPIIAIIPIAGRVAPLSMAVPSVALTAFVHRLKIDWQMPSGLVPVFAFIGNDPRRWPAQAMVRHARAAWHPNQVRLVALMLEKLPIGADDFEPCLAFILSLIPELDAGEDLFQFLTAKKRFYFQSLCKAEAFERQRRSSPMEMMMMQGGRAAHGSIAQWQHAMGRIDRICNALFGRTRFFPRPVAEDSDSRSLKAFLRHPRTGIDP